MDNKVSIELLNAAVADELAAVHQYMYFHFHLDDQGYGALAALLKRTAIVEMGHVEKIAERILFLKGDVKMVCKGTVAAVTDPTEIIAMAAEMERQSVVFYNNAAQKCGANMDSASKQLFESLVIDEETHFDQFDTQLEHLRKFGPSYLALQALGKEPPTQG
ncbi:MAG: bacterioferritin [Acidobacteria bacterium]|nr:MAG: bacterioferritin [Acidobacteriota bacterium]